MKLLTGLAEFATNAKSYNFLPVCASLLGDRETPVSLFEKLVQDETGFLLESAEANKNFGRYSFLGFRPLFTMLVYKDKTVLEYAGGRRQELAAAPLAAMRQVMGSFKAPQMKGLPPFCGGMMGYLSYEVAATWEKIKGVELGADELLAETMLCQDVVIMDHLTHTLYFVTWSKVAGDVEELYKDACLRLRDLVRSLRQPLKPLGKDELYTGGVAHQPSAEKYCAQVDKIKEYIGEGETYQTVLSMPYKRLLPVHPFRLYRRLRRDNPSPYMFYLHLPQKKLVGASPEMLVRVLDGVVTTYPIAGTRPRGKTGEQDELLRQELLQDKKELAEHSMLVDLGRNDIGKVSELGTVKVTRLMDVEYFSHVMHIVSEVNGQLAAGKDAFAALEACFPAGTVSGAPKVRAMEIIAELEDSRRGVYAGAVGYWDFNGNMDTCIAIRTMSIDGDVVTVQGGAGIVADSDPATEAAEVGHKTRVLLNMLEEVSDYADLD